MNLRRELHDYAKWHDEHFDYSKSFTDSVDQWLKERLFKVGDRVRLFYSQTGTVTKVKDNIPWGFKYIVRVRKATLNYTNERIEQRGQDMVLEDN